MPLPTYKFLKKKNHWQILGYWFSYLSAHSFDLHILDTFRPARFHFLLRLSPGPGALHPVLEEPHLSESLCVCSAFPGEVALVTFSKVSLNHGSVLPFHYKNILCKEDTSTWGGAVLPRQHVWCVAETILLVFLPALTLLEFLLGRTGGEVAWVCVSGLCHCQIYRLDLGLASILSLGELSLISSPLTMESVAADVQKTSQLLSALSPRAHSLNLRCFLKFPPALPNLSICGYHDLTGLPYPQWFHHRGESIIQRSNPNWGEITNKASQDFVRYCESHFGRILRTCLSPLSQFCPLCRGPGIHALHWLGLGRMSHTTVAPLSSPLSPCSQRAASLRLMACSPHRSISFSWHMVLLLLPS